MSRYRNIHCLIWNDDKFPYVSDDCQLVFFHVMTTPLSTPFGLFKASIEMLASEKRWPVKRYEKAFREGLAKAFFKYDEKTLVLLVQNFLNYNPPNNPNVLMSWKNSYHEIPDCQLKDEFYSILKDLLKGFREGFRDAFDKAFGILAESDSATDTVSDTVLRGGEEKGGEPSVEAISCAQFLSDKIFENFPKRTAPTKSQLMNWAREADKVYRIDGHSWGDIKELLAWSQKDVFWRQNILSMDKFRKQWNKLMAKKESVIVTKADKIRQQSVATLKRGIG